MLAISGVDVSGQSVAQTLRGFGHGWQGQHNSTNAVMQPAVLAFTTTSGEDGTGRGTPVIADAVVPALPASLANSGTGHNKDELIVAQHGQYNATFDREVAPTLTCLHEQPYLVKPEPVHPTLNTTHFGKHFGCNQHFNELGTILPVIGKPRRLTPLECERLMGWPDQHTAHGVKEDGTAYALSDTARYRLCGNGVGTPVAAWIASRLMAEEVACPTP